jgi:hypothetical protein
MRGEVGTPWTWAAAGTLSTGTVDRQSPCVASLAAIAGLGFMIGAILQALT